MNECRHIFINGTKCKSSALHGEPWCYFHERIYRDRLSALNQTLTECRMASVAAIPPPVAADHAGHLSERTLASTNPVQANPAHQPQECAQPFALHLPLLEDTSSVYLALSHVIQALALGAIDPKRASLLLYGLQIASRNFDNPMPLGWYNTVTDVAVTDQGLDIACESPGHVRKESLKQLAARLQLTLKVRESSSLKKKKNAPSKTKAAAAAITSA